MISAPSWSLGRSSQPMSWYWLTPWYRCCGHIFSGKMFSLWDNLKVPSCTYRGLLVIFLINRFIYTETLPHPKISLFTRKIPLTPNALVEILRWTSIFNSPRRWYTWSFFFFKAQESRLSQLLKTMLRLAKTSKVWPSKGMLQEVRLLFKKCQETYVQQEHCIALIVPPSQF